MATKSRQSPTISTPLYQIRVFHDIINQTHLARYSQIQGRGSLSCWTYLRKSHAFILHLANIYSSSYCSSFPSVSVQILSSYHICKILPTAGVSSLLSPPSPMSVICLISISPNATATTHPVSVIALLPLSLSSSRSPSSSSRIASSSSSVGVLSSLFSYLGNFYFFPITTSQSPLSCCQLLSAILSSAPLLASIVLVTLGVKCITIFTRASNNCLKKCSPSSPPLGYQPAVFSFTAQSSLASYHFLEIITCPPANQTLTPLHFPDYTDYHSLFRQLLSQNQDLPVPILLINHSPNPTSPKTIKSSHVNQIYFPLLTSTNPCFFIVRISLAGTFIRIFFPCSSFIVTVCKLYLKARLRLFFACDTVCP